MPEKWRIIPDFPDYAISNQGRVMRVTPHKRTFPGRIVKAFPNKDGYLSVHLCKRKKRVSQLVALCFLGPCPNGQEINHKDSIRNNDKSTNLEYITHKENVLHGHAFGFYKSQKGELNHNAKLTKQDIFSIINFRTLGWSLKQIASKFNIQIGTVSRILLGKQWAHLTGIKELP